MVTVHFKLTDAEPLALAVDQPLPLETILTICRARLTEEIGSVIVLRRGKVLGPTALIAAGDTLDVYPAISGG